MANLSEGQHTAEFIISEIDDSLHGMYSRESVTYTVSTLKAGHVVGRKLTAPTVAAAVAQAGNTGNGTSSAPTVGTSTNPRQGTYRVVFESATQFVVFGPDGVDLGHGVAATPFDNEIKFTLTAGGTAWVPGDEFNIFVSAGVFKYLEYNPANTDGSQVVAGVSYSNYDASVADKAGTLVARGAVVRASDLIWFAGATAAQILEGQRQLALLSIIAR